VTDPQELKRGFRIGNFEVRPLGGQLIGPDGTRHLQPKSADVLVCLAAHAGELVEREQLLQEVWGERAVSDEPLTRCIGDLRQQFGDQRGMIETVPKRGYRLDAEVLHLPYKPSTAALSFINRKIGFLIIGLLALAFVITLTYSYVVKDASVAEAGHSVAVLPFVNLSGDPEQEYFSDGLTEEILNTLVAIDDLRVAGRTSSFSFKGKDVDLRTIGEQLNVTNILEGSVRRSGNRLRITVQLVGAADGFHLWSDTYDRELADIFDIQEEIAGEIAKVLSLELGLNVAASVTRRQTDNLDAYTWYLRGIALWREGGVENFLEAIDAFLQSIELDPDYLRAQVFFVDLCWITQTFGEPEPDPCAAEVEGLLRAALELDPESSDEYLAVALASWGLKGDIPAYFANLEKALETDPDNAMIHFGLGEGHLLGMGQPRQALPHFQRMMELDPLDFQARRFLAESLMHMGGCDEATDWLTPIIEIAPEYADTYSRLGLVDYFCRRDLAESLRSFRKALALDPAAPWLWLEHVQSYLGLGDVAAAERIAASDVSDGRTGFLGLLSDFAIAQYRSDLSLQADISRELAEVVFTVIEWHFIGDVSWLLALQRTDPKQAMATYERLFPDLLLDDPFVSYFNHAAAIGLAVLHKAMGNKQAAGILLAKTLQTLDTVESVYVPPARVAIYTIQGDIDLAIEWLRELVDAGWRDGWWRLEREPIYEPLWGEPEFQAIMNEVRADMATQLERVREMERAGELEPLPELAATP
jgi:TolB-like protein/DNA-binding winged helix-turn-helix (wHTH) protein